MSQLHCHILVVNNCRLRKTTYELVTSHSQGTGRHPRETFHKTTMNIYVFLFLKKDYFYTAQTPLLMSALNALHFTSWQTCLIEHNLDFFLTAINAQRRSSSNQSLLHTMNQSCIFLTSELCNYCFFSYTLSHELVFSTFIKQTQEARKIP